MAKPTKPPEGSRPQPPKGRLRLRIAVPSHMVLDEEVAAVTARDQTGEFGIRPGFEPFYTCLAVGILTVSRLDGSERFVAVRRGVLTVERNVVDVVTRDAIARDRLEDLEREVIAEFLQVDEQEKKSDTALKKMQLAAMRQLVQYESVEG